MPDEMYGRTELEREALEAAGWDFLITRAKRPGEPRTNYTEVNEILAERTGQPMWNFNLEHDRAAMGNYSDVLLTAVTLRRKTSPAAD